MKFAGRTAKILAVYPSPCRLLIESGLTACLSGSLRVLMAGALKAKHVDWNSRLITVRGKLLRGYASRHFCLIRGPDTPTTVPYNPSATPISSDIVLTKDLSTSDYLKAYSAVSSDHSPILIDTRCRSSFLNLTCPALFEGPWKCLLPRVDRVLTRGLRYRLVLRIKYA